MISDGAELLLDLGLPAALIGGVVLPLLGAVPDSAMIIASGVGKSRAEANKEIAVGMGTLAGSTIMLVTLPWLGSIILGRVDIVNGQARDGVTKKFSCKSFIKQGVSVFPDVTYSAVIMMISALPYLIVQGADWHWGPAAKSSTHITQPSYIRISALITAIISFILFFSYLILQIFYSVQSKRRDEQRRLETVKRRVIRQMYVSTLNKFQGKSGKESVQGAEDDNKPLLSATKQKQFLGAWRNYRGGAATEKESEESEKGKAESNTEKNVEEPKWQIALKSFIYLSVGVSVVTIFSDPMVSALTALTEVENSKYTGSSTFTKGQYIPIGVFYVSFVITPLCSNASELVSSLMFAAKRTKVNASLTYSQLYGAATMNNTLGLGIFAALIYFQDLDWEYSAEVTGIVLVEFAVGLTVVLVGFLNRHTYFLLMGIFIGFLYFFSILLIWMLEKYANWK